MSLKFILIILFKNFWSLTLSILSNPRQPAYMPSSQPSPPPGCPIKGTANMSREEFNNYAQSPTVDQEFPLSTARVKSTIPRGSGDINLCPAHQKFVEPSVSAGKGLSPKSQDSSNNNWVYPSEQQYYNAMLRKGYGNSVKANEVPFILQIHNAVNERGWSRVKLWEATFLGSSENPPPPQNHYKTTLTKFVGRPKDMSPKAFFKTYFMGYTAPFDRHDWYVETRNMKDPTVPPTSRRYVIDFYSGSSKNALQESTNKNKNGAVDVYLDVRPAVDTFDVAFGRAKFWLSSTIG